MHKSMGCQVLDICDSLQQQAQLQSHEDSGQRDQQFISITAFAYSLQSALLLQTGQIVAHAMDKANIVLRKSLAIFDGCKTKSHRPSSDVDYVRTHKQEH